MHTAPSYDASSSSAFHSEHGFSNWDIFNAFIAPDPWKYMEEMYSSQQNIPSTITEMSN